MDTKLAATIGTAARAARSRIRLTQAEVAELVGIAGEVYGRLERGLMLPSVETLVKVARSLGVTPNDLLGVGRAEPAALPSLRHERPEVKRLLRRVKRLDRRSVRLLCITANTLAGTSPSGGQAPGATDEPDV